MRISDWSSDVCSSDLEIWAFALRRGAERPLTPAYYFGLSLPLYLGWIATTTLGAIFGGVLQDPARYGLDFAFTAVFLTLLVSLWKGKRTFYPWAAAALAAVAGHALLPGVWYIALGGLRSEEHTSELQSLMRTSYAVFCLKKK